MKIYLIRHGKTKGNLEERYIGRTDEPLCEAGKENLKKYQYPQVEMVFTSPMKRCMQTAETIYPGQQYQCIEELRESDFGAFEGHTYKELSGDVRYQAWIDSGGTLPFPGGESRKEVRDRCIRGIETALEIAEKEHASQIAFVVHGGTIMNVMEKYARPQGQYYDFQVKNGEGYVLNLKSKTENNQCNYRKCSFDKKTE